MHFQWESHGFKVQTCLMRRRRAEDKLSLETMWLPLEMHCNLLLCCCVAVSSVSSVSVMCVRPLSRRKSHLTSVRCQGTPLREDNSAYISHTCGSAAGGKRKKVIHIPYLMRSANSKLVQKLNHLQPTAYVVHCHSRWFTSVMTCRDVWYGHQHTTCNQNRQNLHTCQTTAHCS